MRIGDYRILGALGEGGMGIVFRARDERLDREVAIKRLRPKESADVVARERLLREARAAASLSHPNICQIFEVGEDAEGPFLVMELLTGEALSTRIERGPLTLAEVGPLALALAGALVELDRRGLIHRDLKPSNVFLTPSGPKLLDFGLVRPTTFAGALADTPTFHSLTGTGLIVGTPRYMSPEQLRGEPLDPRSDQFAFGALLYEMLAGAPAFAGGAGADVVHAILSEQPRALVGSEAIAAVNRIVLRAVSKRRDDRYPSPRELSAELARAFALSDAGSPVTAQARSRLGVVPLRVAPPGGELDFLGPALAESIAASLAGLESLTVRFARPAEVDAEPNLRALARTLEVDLLLVGTLLRSQERLRATVQLVDGVTATVLGSVTVNGAAADLFALEDALVARVADSLALPFTERERRLARREVPRSAAAHEFFLRAQELRQRREGWTVARELYRRAVDEDSRYAPAWAGLARIEWLIAKYAGEEGAWRRAEEHVGRALELAPQLAAAHGLAAEIDLALGRPLAALDRLLGRIRERPGDVDLFASLVAACRYAGLLDASFAADRECRRLDPQRITSVNQTWALAGEWQLALELGMRDFGYFPAHCLVVLGREAEALERLREREPKESGAAKQWLRSLRARLEGDRAGSRAALEVLSAGFPDPEGRFFVASAFAAIGELERALEELDLVVDAGYAQPRALLDPRWTGALVHDQRLAPLVTRAEEAAKAARRRFEERGGARLVGLALGVR